MDKEIKKIQLDLDDLLMSVDNIDDERDDVYNMERSIQELNANYDKLDDRYSRLKEEIEEQPDCEKPLINKLKTIQNDLKKFKKKMNEKEDKLGKLKRISKFYDGELEGAEKMKAERDIMLQDHKNIDNQGLIIDSIQENVKAVGQNLTNINTELDSQGQKMDRIQEKVLETEDQVKKTGKIMGKMEKRQNCMKILTVIAIIIFALFDLAWIAFLLYHKY